MKMDLMKIRRHLLNACTEGGGSVWFKTKKEFLDGKLTYKWYEFHLIDYMENGYSVILTEGNENGTTYSSKVVKRIDNTYLYDGLNDILDYLVKNQKNIDFVSIVDPWRLVG